MQSKADFLKERKMKKITIITLTLGIFFIIGGCAKHELNAYEDEKLTENTQEVTEEIAFTKAEIPKSVTTIERLRREDPKAYEQEMLKMKKHEKDTLLTAEVIPPITPNKYAVQLSCVKDRSNLDNSIKKLEEYGYHSEVSRRESGGCVYFRLRLDGEFSKKEAKEMGEKVKDQILDITDYLVLKVN